MILPGYATLMLFFTILRNLPIDLLGVETVVDIFSRHCSAYNQLHYATIGEHIGWLKKFRPLRFTGYAFKTP